jgi:hypothetical protein
VARFWVNGGRISRCVADDALEMTERRVRDDRVSRSKRLVVVVISSRLAARNLGAAGIWVSGGRISRYVADDALEMTERRTQNDRF